MENIEIDFEVFKALTARRSSESVSYNDVLRELIKLGPTRHKSLVSEMESVGEWISEGVHFPNGTEFRAKYKGQYYYGKVETGSLVVGGKSFQSPSPAATFITGSPWNGWRFWECKFPGKANWQMICFLRK